MILGKSHPFLGILIETVRDLTMDTNQRGVLGALVLPTESKFDGSQALPPMW
eukprot:CAMPEP_0178632714 /NCGR_PEP_ID=MMETSP0698-20121128/11683_1 /TAXON_ID=265572 /ORGANISM="Extubocellulus spinifer, Strain CCMP396" /LENGTH=51 /DNA_ID=CAMNT_0020272211 /DNA_START=530 /DNA_END=682 /DNA_ORIENTATION=+